MLKGRLDMMGTFRPNYVSSNCHVVLRFSAGCFYSTRTAANWQRSADLLLRIVHM